MSDNDSDRVFIELTDDSGNIWALKLSDNDGYSIGLVETSDTEHGTIFMLEVDGDGFRINVRPETGSFQNESVPLMVGQVPGQNNEFFLEVTSDGATYTQFEAISVGEPGEENHDYFIIISGELVYMQVEEFTPNATIYLKSEEASDTSKQKWKFRSASGDQKRIVLRFAQTQ